MVTTIRLSTPADSPFLLSTLDACVEWLVSKGLAGQWGTQPFSKGSQSEREKIYEKFELERERGLRCWIAEVDGKPGAAIKVSPYRPDYLPVSDEEKPGREFFIKELITRHEQEFAGLGKKLLDFAIELARKEHADWVRLDCWRGGEGKDGLMRYYQRYGFVPCREFVISATEKDADWPGQLLEIRLDEIDRAVV